MNVLVQEQSCEEKPTAFERRLKKGSELQKKVIEEIEALGYSFFLTGYENLIGSKDSFKEIRRNDDETSEFIRFYPDLSIILKDFSVLLEVKNSSGIERSAFENYTKLQKDLGLNVFLYLKNNKICSIDKLKFCDVDEYDKVAEMYVPVNQKIWKTPRELPDDEYYEYLKRYRKRGKYTSGCAFAFIDWKNTFFYSLNEIKEAVKRTTEPAYDSVVQF